MALYVVATPIGHPEDISLRALELLRKTHLIIGEEKKEVGRLIAKYQLGRKEVALLNEHSTASDIQNLLALCCQQDAVLVSDCGTPSFCDPGFQLVKACRQKGIRTLSVPGASSLMALLALASQRIASFYFRGFLPANSESRAQEWERLKRLPENIVLMDTPYRLSKTLKEVAHHYPERRVLLGLNLTQEDEQIHESTANRLLAQIGADKKAEFILLLYAQDQAEDRFLHLKKPRK